MSKLRRLSLMTALVLGASAVGCAPEQAQPFYDVTGPLEVEQAQSPQLPPGYQMVDGLVLWDEDVVVGTAQQWEQSADPGELELRRQPVVGYSSGSKLWGGREIPFVIDPDMAGAERVEEAMEHWEEALGFSFVPKRWHHNSYLDIYPGIQNYASAGKSWGSNNYSLASGGGILGIAIAKSSDQVYTWYSNSAERDAQGKGSVSVGHSSKLSYYHGGKDVSFPPGQDPDDVVGIAIDGSDHVFTYFRDGTFYEGTSTDLDRYRAGRSYSVANGRSPLDIRGIDIAGSSGKVYTWYSDNTRSVGTLSDLDAHQGATAVSLPTGFSLNQAYGVAIAGSNDHVFSWFHHTSGKTRLVGSSTRLDAHDAGEAFVFPSWGSAGRGIHELGHVVGLRHTQRRCDRPSHLRLHPENLAAGKTYGVEDNTLCSSSFEDYGDYDIHSVMHYPGTWQATAGAWSWSGRAEAGVDVADMLGIAIDKDDQVISWFDNQMFSIGWSRDLDVDQGMRRFDTRSVPANSFVAMAIAPDTNRVYYWRADGRVNIGSPSDHDAHLAWDGFYTLPEGRSPEDILGAAIDVEGVVYMFYNNGTYSYGTYLRPGAGGSGLPFSLPAGYRASDILGVAFAKSDNDLYTWFDDGYRSVGTPEDLDRFESPEPFSSHGHFVPGQRDGLSDKDIEGVELMYGD